jgi:hypothetical protein
MQSNAPFKKFTTADFINSLKKSVKHNEFQARGRQWLEQERIVSSQLNNVYLKPISDFALLNKV